MQPFDKALHGSGIAHRTHLDAAVTTIAHPARNFERAGHLYRPVAEPYALDLADNTDIARNHNAVTLALAAPQ